MPADCSLDQLFPALPVTGVTITLTFIEVSLLLPLVCLRELSTVVCSLGVSPGGLST